MLVLLWNGLKEKLVNNMIKKVLKVIYVAINYFCSGFDLNDVFGGKIGEKLRQDIKDTKSIVYIPGGISKIEKAREKYIPIFNNAFKKIGIEFDMVYLITSDMNSSDVKGIVKNASFVMLMGGCPYQQKELCEELDLIDTLKEYDGVLLGMSAGAMFMSKNIIIVPCSLEYPEFRVEPGLNLANISIYPHNNFNGDKFPEKIILDEEITKTDDLIKVALEYGEFYLLQDNWIEEKEMAEVSLIRVDGNEIEFITVNNGRVWKVTSDGIKLVTY